MNNEDIIRKLNSVGKEKFTTYYDLFKQYADSKISKENAIQILVTDGVSNHNGASIRLGNAKLIFENNKQNDALKIIYNSRIPNDIRKSAKNILKDNQAL